MSKVAIKGAATGTGVFTLESPATNTDRTLVLPDEAGTVLTTAGVPASAMPAGSVLQVVTATNTTHYYSNSSSYIDLLEASITPLSSSSKILITATLAISKDNNESFLGRMVRDGSPISGAGGANASGTQENGNWWNVRSTPYSPAPYTIQYLDSPSSTSTITYKAQGKTSNAAIYFAINRAILGTTIYSSPTFSAITLMEIAA